jgi:YVTN family beta-propeller protein
MAALDAPAATPARALRRAILLLAGALVVAGCNGPHEPVGVETFASPQSHPLALSTDGSRVYVANTTSNSVSVIDTASLAVVAEIGVGLEPVSVALRPNGKQLWVSNHVSDDVAVIDIEPGSPTRHQVVRTIQEIDANGVTRFDEPVGIAFASDAKAYVALSSRNDIAVIDTATYEVTDRIHITAQEPRALEVRHGNLYVLPFESNNQSELSVCPEELAVSPPQCTLLAKEVGDFITRPNLPGEDIRIVIDPDVPDRDLYVIDTATDDVVEVVDGIGTLLYGLAVSSAGEVFISQTDARNAVNGDPGSANNLAALENRIFDNQIARVACGTGAPSCGAPARVALEPALPLQPGRDLALATPYGIAISDDDATLVVTAAGTSRLFTFDTASDQVLGVVDLGPDAGMQIPKGVALRSAPDGSAQTAYVLNTLENTVSVVDVADPTHAAQLAKIPVGNDPTPEAVRLGRIAFNSAFASTSATFSCESCHPDGNTDQLLWRIGGACFFGACSGDDEVRSTMPVRGLTQTIPLHWDGTLGDPFGGVNGAVGPGVDLPPSCGDEHGCFRHLVDVSLAGVMCEQAPCATGPSGLAGELGEAERENMAFFLASVRYPPARSRSLDDSLSASALAGFSDFFVDQGGIGSIGGITACGDMDSGCHSLPLLAGTNTNVLQGFDAPTLRGLTDRWLQFSIGISNAEESLVAARSGGPLPFGFITLQAPPSDLPWDPADGFDERVTFAASFNAFEPIYNVFGLDIFQMLEEMSTGYSGALGRQVTLNEDTAGGARRAGTEALLAELEAADAKGVVNLRGEGRSVERRRGLFGGWGRRSAPGRPASYSYRQEEGLYVPLVGAPRTREELLDEAEAGELVLTFTAALRENHGAAGHPQPLLAPANRSAGPIGNPDIPLLPSAHPLVLAGFAIHGEAGLFVDGQPADGSVRCQDGSFTPYCESGLVEIELATLPAAPGLHTLQVQNPAGPLSNELPMCTGTERADCF